QERSERRLALIDALAIGLEEAVAADRGAGALHDLDGADAIVPAPAGQIVEYFAAAGAEGAAGEIGAFIEAEAAAGEIGPVIVRIEDGPMRILAEIDIMLVGPAAPARTVDQAPQFLAAQDLDG